MSLVIDSLVARIVTILLLGAVLVTIDFFLLYWLLVSDTQSGLQWALLVFLIVSGLIFVAYVISWQLVKPLKQLADDARRFGSDIHHETLTLKGPRELREVAANFNIMQQRIESFVDERMQLVAAISHDLKTPLTRLRLRVEHLPDDEQKRKAMADINDMNSMIQSAIAFIKQDADHEVVEKVNVTSLVQSVCDDVSDSLGPAVCQSSAGCVLNCKPIAMKRALSNVIENAVRYGQCASVDIKREGEHFKIIVKDKGPGIPENELENVFIPFYRVEKSRSRETGGVGLGLSVSRTLVREQGGEVILENGEKEGLNVTLVMPIVRD